MPVTLVTRALRQLSMVLRQLGDTGGIALLGKVSGELILCRDCQAEKRNGSSDTCQRGGGTRCARRNFVV